MTPEEIKELLDMGYRCSLYGDRLHLCLGDKCGVWMQQIGYMDESRRIDFTPPKPHI